MQKIYVFLSILCITCQPPESRLNSKLKGHWLAVKREDTTKDTIQFDPNEPPPPPAPPGGIPLYDELFFYSDDSLERYSLRDYWINQLSYRHDSMLIFITQWRFFRITAGHQLQVFESDTTQWQTKGDINLVRDTLILKDKDWVTKYIQLRRLGKTDFDEIILNHQDAMVLVQLCRLLFVR
ncbi:MAG: hypothetical protein R2822_29195 [Spirosomataceae bacterium]